jgi:hypothetical protein
MPITGINSKSFSFRVWLFLHRIWMGDRCPDDPKTLCGYAQKIVWGCLFTALCSPLILLGWLLIKTERALYKRFSKSRWAKKWLEELEAACEERNERTWGTKIEIKSQRLEEVPALNACVFGLGVVAVIGIAAIVIFLATCGVWALIVAIPKIPAALWTALLYVGWALNYAFFGIGWFILALGSIMKWGVLALLCVLPSILKWVAIIVGGLATATLLTVAVIKFFQTRLGEWLIDRLKFKYNGFAAAREDYCQRREDLRRQVREKMRKKQAREQEKPRVTSKVIHVIVSVIVSIFVATKNAFCWVKETLWSGKVIETEKGAEIEVLGFFPLIWRTLHSIYKGICPLVVVIREEEKETPPQ